MKMGHVEMKLEVLCTVKYLNIIICMSCPDGNQHVIRAKSTWTQLEYSCVDIKNVEVTLIVDEKV